MKNIFGWENLLSIFPKQKYQYFILASRIYDRSVFVFDWLKQFMFSVQCIDMTNLEIYPEV